MYRICDCEDFPCCGCGVGYEKNVADIDEQASSFDNAVYNGDCDYCDCDPSVCYRLNRCINLD